MSEPCGDMGPERKGKSGLSQPWRERGVNDKVWEVVGTHSIIAASTASKLQTLAYRGGLRGHLSALSHTTVRKDGAHRQECSSESGGSQLLPEGLQYLGVF